MSWLSKIRKKIHTTPILREVSQGFANAFGMGSAYQQFDEELGIGAGGTTMAQGNVSGNIAADVLISRLPRQYAEEDFYDYEDEDQRLGYDDDYDVEMR
jgi:hypothetical protein